MKITIETIPHDQQRYPTVGDWFYDKGGELHIRVSRLGDWRKEALVAVHELVEVLICKHRGISQREVDRFDMQFEKDREAGKLEHPDAEPGDDLHAPYRREHCIATAVERLLCAELDVAWDNYADAVEALS